MPTGEDTPRPSRAGAVDAFVARFDPLAAGSASLLYSTFLGGSADDKAMGLALGGVDVVYVTGKTKSSNFPVVSAYQASHAGGSGYDVFVLRLDLASNNLLYSTYLGGTGNDEALAIAVNGAGEAYITGLTHSDDFPIWEAIQASRGGDGCSAPPCADAFVAKLEASGSGLAYASYLGGSGTDMGNGIAVDGNGGVYIAGESDSSDFPVTPGAYDTSLDGSNDDAFIVKLGEPPPPSGMLPGFNWHYGYDGLARLVYACSEWDAGTSACLGDSFSYSYDGAGNLLSFSRWDEAGGQVETVGFVYNGANQIACLDGNGNGACGDPEDTAYAYDSYGNLTGDGIKTYTYDAENRLASVSDGVSTTTYAYNGDGDRMSQTVDGVTTSYVIDVATPLTMVLAETTGTETIYYLHGLDLVAQSDGVSTEYFGYDGLGSVRQMWGSSGSVLFAQVFDPYGNPYASAGTDSTSWGFTGEQTDSNGLIFLRARYYNPTQGSFLQQDSWQGEYTRLLSLNRWGYVEGNPINFTDPMGKRRIQDWISYQMELYRRGIFVDLGVTGTKGLRLVIRDEEIELITANFEPNRAGVDGFPGLDVQCYYSQALVVAMGKVKAWAPKNYNRYDWLFSGWVDYWAFRAQVEGREVFVKDPNLVKAIAWQESKVGNVGNRILNITLALRNFLRGQPVVLIDGKEKLLTGQERYEALRRYDLLWGLIDYSDLNNEKQEIGAGIRWLYAQYFQNQQRYDGLGWSSDALWIRTLQNYGPGEGVKDHLPCYGDNIWELYRTGRFPLGCYEDSTPDELKTYIYVWSRPSALR